MQQNTTKLTPFEYQGINRQGQKIIGIIEAKNSMIAKAELRKQGVITTKINKQRQSLFSKGNRKITSVDITVFSRQLSTMISAGIPIVQSLEIVADGQTNLKLRKLIEDVKYCIETGHTFAEALSKHPAYFNELFCNLIDAGEKSGTLDVMMDKVASYKEKVETIKKKIKKALTYPIAVLVVALCVTAGLLIYVVPQFQTLFKSFGANLPAMTQAVITMSEFFQAYWYFIFGGLALAVTGFVYGLKNSKPFANGVDKAMLKFPVLGPIIKNAAIARFTRTLSITFAAGLPLIDALTAVAGSTGNYVYSSATEKIKEEIATGQQLHISMKNTNVFPNMVIQMICVGEESGSLEKMLGKAADFYEEEVNASVDALSTLLEPIIMSILGILVGGLVVSMYLPIFKLGAAI